MVSRKRWLSWEGIMVIWLDTSINRLTLRFQHRYALQVMIDASMAVIGLESCSPLQPGTLLLTAGSRLAVADLLEREGRPPCRPILRLVMWGQ